MKFSITLALGVSIFAASSATAAALKPRYSSNTCPSGYRDFAAYYGDPSAPDSSYYSDCQGLAYVLSLSNDEVTIPGWNPPTPQPLQFKVEAPQAFTLLDYSIRAWAFTTEQTSASTTIKQSTIGYYVNELCSCIQEGKVTIGVPKQDNGNLWIVLLPADQDMNHAFESIEGFQSGDVYHNDLNPAPS